MEHDVGTEAPDRTETEFVDTSAMDIDLVNGSEIFNQSFERDPFGRLILPSRVTPMSPTSDSGQISPLPERISSPSPVSSPVAQRSVSRPPLQVTRALTPVTRTDLSPVSRVPVSQSPPGRAMSPDQILCHRPHQPRRVLQSGN